MNAFKDIDMFIEREIAARNESKQIWGNKHAFTKMHDRSIGQLKNIRKKLITDNTNLSIIIDYCIQYSVRLYSISEELHEMFEKIRFVAEDISW